MVCTLTQPSYQWRHDFSKLADGSQNVTALLRHLSTLVNLHRSKVIRWSEHLPQAMLIEPSGPLPHFLLLQSANLVPSLLSSAELTLYSMAAHNVLILIHRPFLILACLKMANSVETYKLSTALAEKSSSICSDSSAEVVRLCDLFNKHYTLRYAVFMVAYFLANACIVRLSDNRSSEKCKEPVDDETLRRGMALLQQMSLAWPVAKRMLDSIQRLESDINERRNRTDLSSNHEHLAQQSLHPTDETSGLECEDSTKNRDWSDTMFQMQQSMDWPYMPAFEF